MSRRPCKIFDFAWTLAHPLLINLYYMNLYSSMQRWRWALSISGIVIVLISFIYTRYLALQLMEEEKRKTELWVMATQKIATSSENEDLTIYHQMQTYNTTIPAILVNQDGNIEASKNINNTDPKNLERILEKIKRNGPAPLEVDDRYFKIKVYYQQSTLLTLLSFFPFIQIGLIATFVAIGYYAVNATRRAEENRVWVGMAKETAHQLGTPISALIAWIEHLRFSKEDDEETMEVLEELQKDVNRLELIAHRFSKIGSAPSLEPIDIYFELEKCRSYMQPRSPRKVKYDFPAGELPVWRVNINPPLFDWVVENLIRNSLDAMGGKGLISAKVYEERDFICIDLSDTGKGIPSSKFKTIFRPGFTTKKRGWGLGLSLAKRIIESYHNGKIFVKNSEINKGTTFTIKLPKPSNI